MKVNIRRKKGAKIFNFKSIEYSSQLLILTLLIRKSNFGRTLLYRNLFDLPKKKKKNIEES